MKITSQPRSLRALPLAKIRKYIPQAKAQGVSEVARARGGFLPAYRRAGGRLSSMGKHKSGEPWVKRRRNFLRRHLQQMIDNGEPLYDSQGRPSRRHLALIIWGFSPDASRL